MWFFFFSSRRRHTRSDRDWSSDVCSSDLWALTPQERPRGIATDRLRESPGEPLHLSTQRPRSQGPVGSSQPLVPGRHAVAIVAKEQLIGPFAGEHHLDVLPRQARDEV